MSMTPEQQAAVTQLQQPDCNLLKISAVSGSGKTHLLTEIVAALKPTSGLYIAYNKAIATEASRKFPSTIECKTTHSLAYRNTVTPFSLKVGYFGYRDIKARISYDNKLHLIETIELFCLSAYTDFETFCTEETTLKKGIIDIGVDILAHMALGQLTCTHAFYLKLYHILLVNGDVVHPTFDLLMLDEAGDLNAVTLEIFKQLPAKKKVMVGDPNQNIYSFNNTINGFEVLADEGIQMGLTKSFRVSSTIAHAVEQFANDTFDPTMSFKGIDYTDKSISSYAYITRTNGQMIERMMYLNSMGIPYNLVRSVKTIFSLPLALVGLKKGGFIGNPQYRYIQDDVEDYYKYPALQRKYSTPLSYIASAHKDNPALKTAINLLTSHGPLELIGAQEIALAHERSSTTYPMTLCTSHSSKGLEFDSVEIGVDTVSTISKLLHFNTWSAEELEEMRLFYVAVTRAKKELKGATPLDKYLSTSDIYKQLNLR